VKVNAPFPIRWKEPAGMVVVKVPACSVTGWATGLIAGAVLLKVKPDLRAKASRLGARPSAHSAAPRRLA
jgi:hypothetical protein